MYNAIWATYYRYCSTDGNPEHDNCPIVEDSWCSRQKLRALNTLSSYKQDYQLPSPDVAAAMCAIYTDLSNEELLEECIGGFKESYNQLTWEMAPKIISCGSKSIEIIGMFNEGKTSLLYYINYLGLSLGPNDLPYVRKEDTECISISEASVQGSTHEGK